MFHDRMALDAMIPVMLTQWAMTILGWSAAAGFAALSGAYDLWVAGLFMTTAGGLASVSIQNRFPESNLTRSITGSLLYVLSLYAVISVIGRLSIQSTRAIAAIYSRHHLGPDLSMLLVLALLIPVGFVASEIGYSTHAPHKR